jgi:predicted AlkP superfamily phosphohydrolase/phosphomutase
MRKVIVVGLDGLEPSILEEMWRAGGLPNLAKLAKVGGYTHVHTTYPAQTPVAWSTFATGTNPGGHGIFDFISRNPKDYSVNVSLSRFEQKNAFLPPRAVNSRQGTALWELLSQAGIPSTVLRCPCTFPPERIKGRMLAGIGVPDLRGGFGTSTFYSSGAGVTVGESERLQRVQVGSEGTIRAHLVGPRNQKDGSDLLAEIEIIPDTAGHGAILKSQGDPRELDIRTGQWSDWLKVKFKAGMLQSVRGMVRFYLVRLEPEFELYASPINFDPGLPVFPLSSPPDYARELESEVGTYYTTGMIEDHSGLNNGRIDETAYLSQCELAFRERERMMFYELERMREGFFFCLFDTADRLQHMFWRFRENRPLEGYGASDCDMTGVIEDHYQACDEIVGRALGYVDEETLFIVLSDHGMNSFQRGFHLNSWLYQNEFLSLKPGLEPGEEAGDLLQGVDWADTRAYAIGLGAIYLNLRGREAEGIVHDTEAQELKSQIKAGLNAVTDSQKGQVAIRSVSLREDIYQGPYEDRGPDLLVNFAPGYRVSWETPLGGVPRGLFADNCKKWSGDHVIDPCLVPGVLLMNRPFRIQRAHLVDLAPTILGSLEVEATPEMQGRSLL